MAPASTSNKETDHGTDNFSIPRHRLGRRYGGLVDRRVLSDHFAQVTIVERDPVRNQPESRKGQPQTRHLHVLLAGGLDVITRYFPDLAEALVAGGAMVEDTPV